MFYIHDIRKSPGRKLKYAEIKKIISQKDQYRSGIRSGIIMSFKYLIYENF